MTNRIHAAIAAISTTYKPNADQVTQIERCKEPDEVARGIAPMVDSMRAAMARELSEYGVTLADVTPDHALSIMYFQVVTHGHGGGKDFRLSKNLPLDVFADLVRAGARQPDWWADLYQEAKGTAPDAEGLAWWKARVRSLFIDGI